MNSVDLGRFVADSGHFFYTKLSGDFVVSTKVEFYSKNMYDQSGLMIRVSPTCWVKTAAEYISSSEPAKLGAVVTNGGWSDWSTQSISNNINVVEFKITRSGSDYKIDALPHGDENVKSWTMIRKFKLHEDDGVNAVQVGVFACSPKGSGYTAKFHQLVLDPKNT